MARLYTYQKVLLFHMDSPDNVRRIFNKRAQRYQDLYMDVSAYGEGLQAFCEQIPLAQAKILEIACGPGNVSRFLLQQRPDWNLLGIDLAEEMVRLAERNNPSARFQQMDARDIKQLEETFDGIVIGFLLPYLSLEDTGALLNDCAQIMRPEALLYLSTMVSEADLSGWSGPSDGGADRMYAYYHEVELLRRTLVSAGFRLEYEQIQPYPGEEWEDWIIIAKKR